jgi:hypothetical protein
MAFTPDPVIKRQIQTLLTLWTDRLSDSDEGNSNSLTRRLDVSLPTKKFLQILNNIVPSRMTYEQLAQYKHNVPEIDSMIHDLNKNTITIVNPSSEDDVAADTTDRDTDFRNANPPDDSLPEPTGPEPKVPAMPELPAADDADAVADAVVGPSRSKIVSQMAKRARARARK